jgi:hypothetical protein
MHLTAGDAGEDPCGGILISAIAVDIHIHVQYHTTRGMDAYLIYLPCSFSGKEPTPICSIRTLRSR